jgi:DNA-damage-inducible protein J
MIVMATANINFDTDSMIKEKSQAILTDLGLDMSTALNLFLRQVIYKEAIPFEITKPKDINSKTNEEQERIRQMRQRSMGL